MATNDFLAFATGGSANVLSQSAYAALSAITNGYTSGVAQSPALNKTWRQSSIMAAVLAQFISDQTGANSTDDGTTATLLANLKKSMPGRLLNVQLFTSSGTYTPTPGMTKFRVRIIGGGGGGGSTAATSTGQTCICGGGGSGSFAEVMYPASAIGASVAVTIAAAASAGSNGNASSFGSLINCPGGGAGAALFGTTSNSVIASAGVPGVQPTVTGSPIYSTTSRGNSGGAGFSISGSLLSGAGAAGWLGQGSPGGSAGGAGAVGLTSGAGGSGAANGPSTGVQSGGVGVGGLCVIEEFA